MSVRFDTRTYTNMILTGIAVLLLAMVLQTYRVSVVSPAQAQPNNYDPRSRGARAGIGSSGPGVTDRDNFPVVQDIAVAAATQEVAAANREIAAALRDVAKAITALGGNLGALRSAGIAGSPAASPMAPAPNPGAPRGPSGEALNISVQ